MKTIVNKGILIGAVLFMAAANATVLAMLMPGVEPAAFTRAANAAGEAGVIEIKAKKFEFSPSEITLKKSQPVILRLTSEDRTHGFFIKPLKIDTDIAAGKSTDISVTPEVTGTYTAICDHYCGTGHGNMKMTVTVVE